MTTLLEVGRINRAHGLKGEVVVNLTSNHTERLAVGSVLHAGDHELVVAASRPHQDRWVVLFEGMKRREDIDALRGLTLLGEPLDGDELDDPDALWVHELIGAEVIDVSGVSHGIVESVLSNPASDILVLESGGLIPLTFVTQWLDRPARIEVDPPIGLLDGDSVDGDSVDGDSVDGGEALASNDD